MLVIKAYINTREIDEIYIQNLGIKDAKKGIYEYSVIKPEKYQGIRVFHRRYESWMELVRKVLNKIKRMEKQE